MGKRVFLIVLDSVGVGEAPDAELFDDVGCDTFGTCVRSGKTIRSGCWIYTVRRTKNIGSYGNAFI